MNKRRFYRIASAKYRFDASGKGAEILGGRFNPMGYSALYAATSISLATLETLVHTTNFYPMSHYIMSIDVPAETLAEFSEADMPYGWDKLDDLSVAQAFGVEKLYEANRLGILVPSVVVPEQHNIVLNPRHRAMQDVEVHEVRPLNLDARLKR